MKVKRIERGYTLFVSEHEYEILKRMEALFSIDAAWPNMPSGERRSWSRRTCKGEHKFLRLDKDYRRYQYDDV